MRIRQLYCNAGEYFRQGLLKKYRLTQFGNHLEPVLFFGCYSPKQAETACLMKGLVLLVWAGSDAMVAQPEMMKKLRAARHIKHIAISNFIAADLQKHGIPYKEIPILPMNNDIMQPEPCGDSIYIYKSNFHNYGRSLNEKVKKALPGMKFIEAGFRSFPREDMPDVYRKCFTGLRFTTHDGLSNTVCELGLMGRKVIWNGNTPNAIPFDAKDTISIVRSIEKQYAERDKYMEVSHSTRRYLDIGDDFLNTESWT